MYVIQFLLGTDDDVRAFQRISPGTPHLGGVPLATTTEGSAPSGSLAPGLPPPDMGDGKVPAPQA
eukprot:127579-Prorocentrum_lima.AAC.1